MIHTITKILGSIFFPSYCYLCKKEGNSLCTICLSKRKLAYDTPHPWITPIYSFKDNNIKKIIHAIKYFHRKDLIAPLSDIITRDITDKQYNAASYILIPIPMPKLRHYIRGYNQAEEIAKCISKKTKIPYNTTILKRIPSQKRQVMTKSRSERLKNPHGTFTVQQSVPSMKIILIDDVTTTGATLSEARTILMQHGAKSVEAYTLAH